MKFGRTLSEKIREEWKSYAVKYKSKSSTSLQCAMKTFHIHIYLQIMNIDLTSDRYRHEKGPSKR